MLVLLLSCFPAAAAVAFLGVAAAFAGFGAFACASGASVDDDDEAGAFAGKANCGGQFGVVTASVLAGPVWKPTGGGVCDLDLGDVPAAFAAAVSAAFIFAFAFTFCLFSLSLIHI